MVGQHLVTVINFRHWIVVDSHNARLLFFFSKVIRNSNKLWCVSFEIAKTSRLSFHLETTISSFTLQTISSFLGFPVVTSFGFPFQSSIFSKCVYDIACKGVPVPTFLRHPPLAPFLKSFFPLPSFLFYPF